MGGRGAGYNIPSGNGEGRFSKGNLGTKVADNLKEAIGTKGKSIEMKRAYEDANPNHDPRGSYDEYNKNCQRCIVAYELRRRGYDVTAQPTYQGDKLPTVVRIDKNNAKWGRWQGAFKNARPESVKGNSPDAVVSNIKGKMKEWGDGSRGVVSITYKGRRFGHVFNVEQRKGQTYFIDAQTGERVRKEFFNIVDKNTVTLTRTDNLRISDRAKNFVTSEDAYKRKRK